LAPSPRTDRRRGGAGAHPRRAPALVAAAALLIAADAYAGEAPRLAFSRHDEPVTTRDLDALKGVAPVEEVRVHEPYELRTARFAALPFDQVLDAIYTPSWRDEEELLFTCSDGYQPTVPVARFLGHRAWLAFDRVDRAGFAIEKRESGELREVALGPFYLIWDNLEDATIRQESDYGWPYQLVGVDLIRSRDRFPKMTPPADAPAEVLAGFGAFRVHCSKCHRVHGEGGQIGPELASAASPLAHRDPDWLRTWIVDPKRILPEARMPALNPSLPDRERVVKEILAYLHAMRPEPEPVEGR
jgi:cytochrome c2